MNVGRRADISAVDDVVLLMRTSLSFADVLDAEVADCPRVFQFYKELDQQYAHFISHSVYSALEVIKSQDLPDLDQVKKTFREAFKENLEWIRGFEHFKKPQLVFVPRFRSDIQLIQGDVKTVFSSEGVCMLVNICEQLFGRDSLRLDASFKEVHKKFYDPDPAGMYVDSWTMVIVDAVEELENHPDVRKLSIQEILQKWEKTHEPLGLKPCDYRTYLLLQMLSLQILSNQNHVDPIDQDEQDIEDILFGNDEQPEEPSQKKGLDNNHNTLLAPLLSDESNSELRFFRGYHDGISLQIDPIKEGAKLNIRPVMEFYLPLTW